MPHSTQNPPSLPRGHLRGSPTAAGLPCRTLNPAMPLLPPGPSLVQSYHSRVSTEHASPVPATHTQAPHPGHETAYLALPSPPPPPGAGGALGPSNTHTHGPQEHPLSQPLAASHAVQEPWGTGAGFWERQGRQSRSVQPRQQPARGIQESPPSTQSTDPVEAAPCVGGPEALSQGRLTQADGHTPPHLSCHTHSGHDLGAILGQWPEAWAPAWARRVWLKGEEP